MTTSIFEVPSAERNGEVTTQYAQDLGDSSFIVNWQPGNGTWYRVMFTPMTPELVKAAGFSISGKAWLVTWIIPGEPCQSYVLRENGFLTYDYVQENDKIEIGWHMQSGICFRKE